jgi:hypothetical protein
MSNIMAENRSELKSARKRAGRVYKYLGDLLVWHVVDSQLPDTQGFQQALMELNDAIHDLQKFRERVGK